MNPFQSDEINGHLIEHYVCGRDTVVYIDCNRWDASYASAVRWAELHPEKWICPLSEARPKKDTKP